MESRYLLKVDAITEYLLGFTVYCGKDYTGNGSSTTMGVVDDSIHKVNLQGNSGRVLYVDNYHTSVSLGKHMYGQYGYGWFLVGTLSLSDKEKIDPEDRPFHKLSEGADRDSADISRLYLSNPTCGWYYLHVMAWLLDRVVFGVNMQMQLTRMECEVMC